MKANIRLLLTIIAVSAIIFACLPRPSEVTVTIAVLTRTFVVSAGLMTIIRDWPKPNWIVLGFVVFSMVAFLALDRASYSTPMFRESIIKSYGLDLDVDPTEDFNQYVRVTTQAIHLILSLMFGIVVSFAIPKRESTKHLTFVGATVGSFADEFRVSRLDEPLDRTITQGPVESAGRRRT